MVQAFSDILIYIYRAQAASDTISHLPSVPNKITENQKRLQKKCTHVGTLEKHLHSYPPLILPVYPLQLVSIVLEEKLRGFHESTGQSFATNRSTAIFQHRTVSVQ